MLAEVGLPVTDHTPTTLDHDLVDAADVAIILGCGGRIVADLDTRVRALLGELAPELDLPPSVFDTAPAGT
ncbi:hypothetical protein [Trujillonella humicola]|uniref:hypothetical protein n=1 Tax=Trujillonella humicola TaxID=3383699 RepID=UPI0039058595